MPVAKSQGGGPSKPKKGTFSPYAVQNGIQVATGEVVNTSASGVAGGTGNPSAAVQAQVNASKPQAPKPAPGPWESGAKTGKWEQGAVGQWKANTTQMRQTPAGSGGGAGGGVNHAGTSKVAATLSSGGHVGSHNSIEYFDGTAASDPGSSQQDNAGFTGATGGTGTAAAAFTSSKAKAAADTETRSTRRIGLKRTEAPRARTY